MFARLTIVSVFMLAMSLSMEAQAGVVRVATWNVFDLPEQVFPVDSSTRLHQAVSAMQSVYGPLDAVDAIVFNELYVPRDKAKVFADLNALGFVHRAELTSRDPRDLFSLPGIAVVSRWPIERQAGMVFRDGWHGLDGFTLKGVLYVKLIKETDGHAEPINLFATHLYNGVPNKREASKREQAKKAAAFVAKNVANDQDLTILAGDLNTDWSHDGQNMLALLRAHPVEFDGALTHTFPMSHHMLSGDPRQSPHDRCKEHKAHTSTVQYGKWIDYVVAVAPGREPRASRMQAYEVTALPYHFGGITDDACLTDILSDHHLVMGTFELN